MFGFDEETTAQSTDMEVTTALVLGLTMREQGRKSKKPTKTALARARNGRRLERARAAGPKRRGPFPFMELPVEVRVRAYRMSFTKPQTVELHECMFGVWRQQRLPLELLLATKTIYLDARAYAYYDNSFSYTGSCRSLCGIKDYVLFRLIDVVIDFVINSFRYPSQTAEDESWNRLICDRHKLRSLHLRISEDVPVVMHGPMSTMIAGAFTQMPRTFFELELRVMGGKDCSFKTCQIGIFPARVSDHTSSDCGSIHSHGS